MSGYEYESTRVKVALTISESGYGRAFVKVGPGALEFEYEWV